MICITVAIIIPFSGYRYSKGATFKGKFVEYFPKSANVLREGKMKPINACDLVPGDIIEVKEGELIPADIRLIKPKDMKIDKYFLTVRIWHKHILG